MAPSMTNHDETGLGLGLFRRCLHLSFGLTRHFIAGVRLSVDASDVLLCVIQYRRRLRWLLRAMTVRSPAVVIARGSWPRAAWMALGP